MTEKKNKIIIATGIYPPDIGGPATYTRILEEGLTSFTISVEVLSFGVVRHLPRGVRHFVYFLKLLKKARGVDIIYALDPVSVGFPASLVARILRKKFLLRIVGDYAWEMEMQNTKRKTQKKPFITLDEFQESRFGFFTEIRRSIQRHVTQRADMIIVPSKYLEGIVSRWGVDKKKLAVIYNAFKSQLTIEDKSTLRAKLGISGMSLVSVGRLVPWKGFDALIRIFPEILRDFPDTTLFIIGDGPEYKDLRFKILDLRLGNNVKLLGRLPQKEMLQYLKASDLFVLNTGYEGFSHLLLESSHAGTPIITTRVCGNPEFIENEKTGLLIDYNDEGQIKESIARVLNDKVLRERIVENARVRVSSFSEERMVGDTISIVKNLAGLRA